MPTFCRDCLLNSNSIPNSDSIPRPPGCGSSSLQCEASHIFDMEGAPCAPYDCRTISTFEDNLCHDCIQILPGELLPEPFRLVRMGQLPENLSEFSIRPVLRFNGDIMYQIEIDDRSIYVMGEGFSLVPSRYWDGTNEWIDVEDEGYPYIQQENCVICDDRDQDPTLNEIVQAIFNEFEFFSHHDCGDFQYNSDGDVIFSDNGDEGWVRTMSGGEESDGECDNRIFSSDDESDTDSDY